MIVISNGRGGWRMEEQGGILYTHYNLLEDYDKEES